MAGIAALEALTGLRALAGERVDATLLAPDRSSTYRPLSMAVPFTFLDERNRPLQELAAGLGATFVREGLAQVDEARGRVLTQSGDFLPYDALVIAVGAHLDHRHRDMTWSRSANATSRFGRIVQEIEAGAVRRLALVVPPQAAWLVDAYELALVASLAAERAPSKMKISVFTAEKAPLEAFGAGTAEATAAELARAGIGLVPGVAATLPGQTEDAGRGALLVGGRAPRSAEAPVGRAWPAGLAAQPRLPGGGRPGPILPAVHGPAVAGMSHEPHGFLPVDDHARVSGQSGIYAAGDATSLTLKHSTLASAQATAAAEAIAAAAGADIDPRPWSATLYGILTLPPHFAAARGSPWLRKGEPVTHCLWWPPGHVAGRHLAPYLASSDPGVRPGIEWHPNGIPVAVPVGGRTGEAATAPAMPPEAAIRQNSIARQILAIRGAKHEGPTSSMRSKPGAMNPIATSARSSNS